MPSEPVDIGTGGALLLLGGLAAGSGGVFASQQVSAAPSPLAEAIQVVVVCVVWACVALYAIACGLAAAWRHRGARQQARRVAAELANSVAAIQRRPADEHND